MLGSVIKAGRVLDLFTPEEPEWGVSEVAAALDIAKSSAHALLLTLDNIGLVRRMPDGRYQLGWRIVELHRTVQHGSNFLGPHAARFQRIADELQATVHVGALHGHEVIYLDKIAATRGPTIAESGVGLAMPAHCTALGKMLLASLGAVDTDAVLALHGLPRRTPRTITNAAGLQDELDDVRRRGHAYDIQESLPTVSCVAAPIRDRRGDVEAAVSLTLHARRFPQCRVQAQATVRTMAEVISRRRRAARAVDSRRNGPATAAM